MEKIQTKRVLCAAETLYSGKNKQVLFYDMEKTFV
jgi:hypothetical protein